MRFDLVNQLAQRAVKFALQDKERGLAEELMSYLPVEDEDDLRAFSGAVRVARTRLEFTPDAPMATLHSVVALAREVVRLEGVLFP